MVLSRVALRQRDGPTMARNSPRAASSEMPSMATSGAPLPSSKTFLTFWSATRAAMSGASFGDDAAADDGLERPDVLDRVLVDRHGIGRQDRKIREFSDLDRADAMFGEGIARRGAGGGARRPLAGGGLVGAIDRAGVVLARDRDRHVHEGVEQVDRIIGALGHHVDPHMVDHRAN